MVNLKNRAKDRKGFTLVEVVVVAVIVAVLAAVGIGVYLSYVSDARKGAVQNQAGAIASFCGACINSGNTVDVTAIGSGSIACTGNNTSISFDQQKHTVTHDATAKTITVTDAKDNTVTQTLKY